MDEIEIYIIGTNMHILYDWVVWYLNFIYYVKHNNLGWWQIWYSLHKA